MADKICTKCQQSYPEDLSVCPHCQHVETSQSEEDVQQVSEEDIVEVLAEDENIETVPGDAMALADASNEPVEVVEEMDSADAEPEEDVVEVTQEEVPAAVYDEVEAEPEEDVVEVIDEEVPAPTHDEAEETETPFSFSGGSNTAEETSADEPDVIAQVEDTGLPETEETSKPADPKKTSLRKIAPETKLAPDMELFETSKPADPKKTSLRKIAPETKLAPDMELFEAGEQDKSEGGEEEETPSKPEDAKKTTLRPKIAPSTQLGSSAPTPTMLADTDKPLELPEEEAAAKATGPEEVSEEDLLADEQILTEDSSAIDLGEHPGDRPSGVDLIAEELESRSDLGKAGEEKGIDEESVDLGSAASEEPVPLDIGEEDIVSPEGEEADSVEVGAADLLGEGEETEVPGRRDSALEVSREDLLTSEAETADEIVSEDLLVEEETPKKKKAKILAEEEEEEEEGSGRKKKAAVVQPKYGRRWLGGTLVGMLLAVIAMGGLWFAMPEVIKNVLKQHPAYKERIKDKYPPVLRAREMMNKGQYANALALLTPENDPEAVATRGEARWLKYATERKQQKQQLNPNDSEVKTALQELKSANKELLAQQITETILAKSRADQVAKFQAEKKKVQEVLVNSNVLPPGDPQLGKLSTAVSAAVKARDKANGTIFSITKALEDKKYPFKADPKQPGDFSLPTFEKTIDNLSQAKDIVENLELALQTKRDTILQQVTALKKERQSLEQIRKNINDELAKAKVAMKDAKGVEDLVKTRDQLQNTVNSLQKAIDVALVELNNGKTVKVSPEKRNTKLTELAKILRDKAKAPLVTSVAEIVASVGTVSETTAQWFKQMAQKQALQAQLNVYRIREPFISTPEKKLDTWIALFQDRSQKSTKELAAANNDANWVLSPYSKASPQMRAKAQYLIAMLHRNQHKFDEARKNLNAAVEAVAKANPKPKWAEEAAKALKELQEPDAYYVPLAQGYHKTGQLQQALQTVNTGLQAIPKAPQLLVLRGLIQLEMTRTQKAKVSGAAKQIRADAEAAQQNASTRAKAHYVLGRLEEALGDYSKAEKHYREALKSVPAGHQNEANVYEKALGHLLLSVQNTTPRSKPLAFARTTPAPRASEGTIQSMPLALSLLVAYPGDNVAGDELNPKEKERLTNLIAEARIRLKSEEKAKAAKVKKWLDFAEENLLKKKGLPAELQGQGFMLLGRALSETGKRTDGLKLYLHGLKLFMPNVETEQLDRLVESHPAFQLPDALTRPNPAKADVHFGQGLHFYWDGKYQEAAAEFERALAYHHNDARYHYFFGLALFAQPAKTKREKAEYHFEQAARLEIQSQPSTEEVNESLERIQGQLRQTLDSYRRKAALEGVQ